MEKIIDTQESLLKDIPTPIFESDSSGCFTFVNGEWSRLTGLEFSEALGSGWIDNIHPEDRGRVHSEWNSSILNRVELDTIYRIKRLDNVVRFVRCRTTVLKSHSGMPQGFAGSLQDITEQVRVTSRLDNTSSELEQFFNLAEELLCILDMSGRFKKINPKFQILLGLKENQIIGTKIFDFLHIQDKQLKLPN